MGAQPAIITTQARGPVGLSRSVRRSPPMFRECSFRHPAAPRTLRRQNGSRAVGASRYRETISPGRGCSPRRFGSTSVGLPQKSSVGSYVARVREANQTGVGLRGVACSAECVSVSGYQGAAYLGQSYNPFDVNRDQCYLPARLCTSPIGAPSACENFTTAEPVQAAGRVNLLAGLDTIKRSLDQSGTMDAMDRYQQEAVR